MSGPAARAADGALLVTAALIEEEGRVLLARRRPGKHMGGKWELPGGKIEQGETAEQSLARVQQAGGEGVGARDDGPHRGGNGDGWRSRDAGHDERADIGRRGADDEAGGPPQHIAVDW